VKSLMKRATGALFLLLGIAVGARVILALLAPVLPLVLSAAVLVIVYAITLGLWRRL
jgi:hypothetical protein